MAYQIALAFSKETAEELEKMGFTKQEVYIKDAPGGTTKVSKREGDQEFFAMKYPPYQICYHVLLGSGKRVNSF
jgi:hypothetical protein